MTIINISDDLRLRWEDTCWALEQKKLGQKGARAGLEHWYSLAFYPWLDQALPRILERKLIATGDTKTLAEAVAELKRFHQEAAKVCATLEPKPLPKPKKATK